ncbi:hypothetical protein RDI58_010559 [Solanum bulbocastanum]|uniref:Xylanase inhibitor C-terminal domain-containing protein n=1 Tax=Solanum bulbocastanum TaxID=147425 RepID=A0AAN8TN57_SOLBU
MNSSSGVLGEDILSFENRGSWHPSELFLDVKILKPVIFTPNTLKGIYVAGKALNLNPQIFDGKHGTMLDSGNTYVYLLEVAFVAFKSVVMKELHSLREIEGPDPNYKDICFSGAGSDVSELSKSFQSVNIVYSNGKKLSLTP